jgi:tRNA (guanine37-N1)-methyltransferase
VKIDVVTIFPDVVRQGLDYSILKRARQAGVIAIDVHDLRDHAPGRHRSVDDTPCGGGAGMVMSPVPLFAAVEALDPQPTDRIVMLTPQGRADRLIVLCGHYEGYDERVRQHLATDEISIGDYVLTGGELPALVLIDSVTRLLPGALGSDESAQTDTFSDGLLEYPHYTRPVEFREWRVPDVLLSGNHAEIAKWRRKEQFRRTQERRPDLWSAFEPSKSDLKLLKQLAEESSSSQSGESQETESDASSHTRD